MSKFARIVVLVTALASLFAMLSSTAGAVTFTNSGSTAFTATGGPGTLSINAGASILPCNQSSATGTAAAGAFTAVHGTITFSPCNFLLSQAHVDCSFTLTPTVFDAGTPAVTTGNADVHCIVRLANPSVALCNITGQTPGVYRNPVSPTKGSVTLFASTSLVVSNNSDASCSAFGVPTGQTRNGSLTEQTINITNGTPTTLGPVIASP